MKLDLIKKLLDGSTWQFWILIGGKVFFLCMEIPRGFME